MGIHVMIIIGYYHIYYLKIVSYWIYFVSTNKRILYKFLRYSTSILQNKKYMNCLFNALSKELEELYKIMLDNPVVKVNFGHFNMSCLIYDSQWQAFHRHVKVSTLYQ